MNQSPWLFLDAAQVIFDTAKNRAYSGKLTQAQQNRYQDDGELPPDLVPVLEEQPKWAALSGILDEIERDSHFNPGSGGSSYGTVLVMCSDAKECRQLREYLQTVDKPVDEDEEDEDEDEDRVDENPEREGKTTHSAAYMMRRRLRGYLNWKRDLPRFKDVYTAESNKPGSGLLNGPQAQKRQSESFRGRAPAGKRRRTRGGATASVGPSRTGVSVEVFEDKDANMAQLWQNLQPTLAEQSMKPEIAVDPLEHMEDYYELFDFRNLVVVHPFKGDMDDRLLEELRPSYIVMYNPDTAFVRRVEVGAVGFLGFLGGCGLMRWW